jgi:hypothetical protein
MATDKSRLSKFYMPAYLASYAVTVVAMLILFVALAEMDAQAWTWSISRESAFAGVSVLISAIVGVLVFAIRSRADPSGVIYGLPEGMSVEQRRRATRTYALVFLFGGFFLGWLVTLLLPPCAMRRSCIDFSAPSLLFALAESFFPFLIVVALGKSVANFVCYSASYLRARSMKEM